jgi:recombination protein RecT
MAKKTVLKNMLSTLGILSIDMQEAVISDNKIIKTSDDGAVEREATLENDTEHAVDVEYSFQHGQIIKGRMI